MFFARKKDYLIKEAVRFKNNLFRHRNGAALAEI